MNGNVKDLTGIRFYRLVVINFLDTVNHVSVWNCLCDCGQMRSATAVQLRKGYVRSCGCLEKEKREKFEKLKNYDLLYGEYVTKHKSAKKIALDYGVSDTTVRTYMKMCGIKIRDNSECQQGKHLSDEHKKKISDAVKGENHPNYGVHWSAEVREKMRKSAIGKHSGENNGNYGRVIPLEKRLFGARNPMFGKHIKLSEETKKKILLTKSKNKYICTEETRRKMSLSKKGKYVGSSNPNWRGGTTFDPYCYKFNDEFKERVRSFFEYNCVICGKSTLENTRNLSVHHVNYDKMVCCNDREPCFAALCSSCHTKTNFNREWWMKCLTIIVQYVYEGKSFYTKEEYREVMCKK